MSMKNNRSLKAAAIWAVLLAGLLVYGCAGLTGPKPQIAPRDKSRFEERLDQLIENIVSKQKHNQVALAPVAVLPGSTKSTQPYTRLEEIVMERLEQRLIENNELITLSRQNWFAFREERPLAFYHTRGYTPADMRNAVLYVINIAADDVMEDLWVTITAYNSQNRAISGISAVERFPFGEDQPARVLYESDPLRIPFPEGLEETPYTSLDRFSYSLAGELADAYKTGITAGGAVAADREIRVLLHSNARESVDERLAKTIESALQQAVVAKRGFTCTLSRSDFGPVFEQIDFYRSRSEVFNIEAPEFQAGTIFLMADIFPHPSGESVGVALRAAWRADPLEDAAGAFIPESAAGTYVSGFTAQSYLLATPLRATDKTSPSDRASALDALEAEAAVTGEDMPDAPSMYTVCFEGFGAPATRKIHPVISKLPGLYSLRRADDACDTRTASLGYMVQCQCSPEAIEYWISDNIKTSGGNVVPFQVQSIGEDRIIFNYNGGFE